MHINEALDYGSKILNKSKSTSPLLDTEVLLSHCTKKPKEFLFTYPEKKLTASQSKQFKSLVNKRKKGLPVAYLTGSKGFFGLDFKVNNNVLIPRPDTETMVEMVNKYLIKKEKQSVLDLGTGSGCIAISIAKNNPGHVFYASDISAKALAIAKNNSKAHQTNINFKKGSLLTPWKNKKFDIIVANLPYLPKLLDKSTKFEPRSALISAKKGLALYEELFKQINDPELLVIEFHPPQARAIEALVKEYLPKYQAIIIKDLSNKNRFAWITKNPAT